MTSQSVEQSAEEAVASNIAQIAAAVNSMDLHKYGSLVTADFVNMNQDLQGNVTSTVGRQARLDVLQAFFADSPFATRATMIPSDIFIDGNRAFAQVDGTLQLTPKTESAPRGFTLTLQLFLFFLKTEEGHWQSERSMGIELSRSDG